VVNLATNCCGIAVALVARPICVMEKSSNAAIALEPLRRF